MPPKKRSQRNQSNNTESTRRRSSRKRRLATNASETSFEEDVREANGDNYKQEVTVSSRGEKSTKTRRKTKKISESKTIQNDQNDEELPSRIDKNATKFNSASLDDDSQLPDTSKEPGSTNKKAATSKKMQATLDVLHREMSVAAYSRTKQGQLRRVTPRDQTVEKTKRRKLLEREDDAVLAAEFGDTQEEERLRGGQAALEHSILDGSLPIGGSAVVLPPKRKSSKSSNREGNSAKNGRRAEDSLMKSLAKEADSMVEDQRLGESDGDGEDPGEKEEDDDDYGEENGETEFDDDAQDEGGEEEEMEEQDLDPSKNNDASSNDNKSDSRKKKRTYRRKQRSMGQAKKRLYRLKNFKSYRMAQRHGEALGFHARGMPLLAISRLKQIAQDAPSAPQVYSSLGMVYEDMFQNCWKNIDLEDQAIKSSLSTTTANTPIEQTSNTKRQAGTDQSSGQKALQNEGKSVSGEANGSRSNINGKSNKDNVKLSNGQMSMALPQPIAEALDIAQKAYGSYHIAAILCKRDYSVWVRAADTACDIADIYGQLGDIVAFSSSNDQWFRREQERWYREARGDLQTADNLKPPDLDVPLKLASVYMELGQFSELLTLWTDLLRREAISQSFRHPAWLLYAESMLRIGYECHQWCLGNEDTTDNYMFRRWLRKWSTSFDWKERRLQALVLAFEAAAGSASCRHVLKWIRQRADQRKLEQERTKKAEENAAKEKAAQEKAALDLATEKAAVAFAEALVDGTADIVPGSGTQPLLPNDQTAGVDGCVMQTSDTASGLLSVFGNEHEGIPVNRQAGSAEKSQTGSGRDIRLPSPVAGGGSCSASVGVANSETTKDAHSMNAAINKDPSQDRAAKKCTIEGVSDRVSDTARHELEAEMMQDEYDRERQLLLQSHQQELAAFDQTTENMKSAIFQHKNDKSVSNRSDALKERRDARRKTTRSHASQVNKLESEYRQKIESIRAGVSFAAAKEGDTTQTPGQEDNDLTSQSSSNDKHLPLAASCGIVTKIASELMRHMIDMNLVLGCRLVGEAVSLYMKERASLFDKKMDKDRKRDMCANPLGGLFAAPYDDINDDEESDSDESAALYLSDDDEFQSNSEESQRLLASLHHGVLPPEISVLYAVTLIMEGGKDYVAKKCIESIDLLEQESSSWMTMAVATPGLHKSLAWFLWRASASEPLGRASAYAFVADLLSKSGKEREWAGFFCPMLRLLVQDLHKAGLVETLEKTNGTASASIQFRRARIIMAILAWGRLEVAYASALCDSALECSNSENAMRAKQSVLNTIQHMSRYLGSSGKQVYFVSADGSISDEFLQILDCFSMAYQLIAQDDGALIDEGSLKQLTVGCSDILSWLCLATPERNDDDNDHDAAIFDSTKWNSFPLPSAWQSSKHRSLSLRCYNLCISFNVSHFSGWEKDEFSLRLMKSRANCTYFGLKIGEGKVGGFLPFHIEEELSRQWKLLKDFIPIDNSFDFDQRLNATKQTHWYQTGREKHSEAMRDSPISVHSEQKGLNILLAHSRLCILLARYASLPERHQLLKSTLSVLLPLTQFCLDYKVWTSKIGQTATFDTDVEGWRQITRKKVTSSKASTYKRKRSASSKEPARALDEWFPGEDWTKPLSNIVAIPTSVLQQLWGPTSPSDDSLRPAAKEAMDQVHQSMKSLRACYTDAAVEKASLQVATALLDLVAVPDACENPFLVLQQAAVFASHGSKQGTSDDVLRDCLPSPSECTPIEALVILGRADCFQAAHFPYEAAFLCSFVAKLCSEHREASTSDESEAKSLGGIGGMDDDDHKSRHSLLSPGQKSIQEKLDNQWMVVRIMCYNLSIMIRTTVSKVLRGQTRKEDFHPWDQDVIDELLLGRANAIAWKSALTRGESFSQAKLSVCNRDGFTLERLVDQSDDQKMDDIMKK